MKDFLKKIIPRNIVTVLNRLRPSHRRWLEQNADREAQISRLKSEHEARNADTPPGEMVLHQQRLRIHPASRLAFEYFSYRSPEMVHEMALFLRATTSCHRLMDVGALHGIFSLLFVNAAADRQALAIDASPLAFERLAHNVAANGLGESIITRELALSDREGKLAMHYDWEHVIATSTPQSRRETLSVPMTRGDHLCAQLDFPPDVLKVDVEGHEPKVLRGLIEVISRHRPLIFLEVHPQLIAESHDFGDDVTARLEQLGYQAHTIHAEPVALSELFFHDDRFLLTPVPIAATRCTS